MMAYANQFVASIILGNNPVREFNSKGKRTCIIPFESEYKIRLKNKNNYRTKIEVFIDGTDVLFGEKLVLYPNQTVDLERFLSNNDTGSKFKFSSIKKALEEGTIQDPYNEDNGHVQIKYYKEKIINWNITTYPTDWNYVTFDSYNSSQMRGFNQVYGTANTSCVKGKSLNYCTEPKIGINTGVTTEGSLSDQKFVETFNFETESFPEVIDIWLSGKDKNIEIKDINNLSKIIFDKIIPLLPTCKREWFKILTDSLIKEGKLGEVSKSILDSKIIPNVDKNTKEWIDIFVKSFEQ